MSNDAHSVPPEEATEAEAASDAHHDDVAESGETTRTPSAEEVREQRDEYYDLLLRKTAEFDNYRKRVERERRELLHSAGAEVLEQLLPIIDDLERALDAVTNSDTDSDDAYLRGFEIIRQQLLDLLSKHRVTPMDVLGADFDPHFHQAVVHEPSATHREGEVTEELRRGYMLGDRLLRPAMVKVAKRE